MNEKSNGDLPPLNFSAFLLSLSHNAMMHLEEAEKSKKEAAVQLPMAGQFINILEMLKEKTMGNLLQEEEKLLESLLYDLRMRFIQMRKNQTE